MSFVQRDKTGKIIGVFACAQPGYAEEELPDDSAEVMNYINPPKPPEELRRVEYNARGATIEALVVALFEKDPIEIARLETIRQQVKTDIPKTVKE